MVASAVVGVSGLVGLATFDGASVQPSLVELMAAEAPYRSEDGTEIVTAPGAVFAYQRRRVLAGDADERGAVERDGYLCVADARLDNRAELLAGLAPDSRPGEDASEAEIILAVYRRWGRDAPMRLIGDFAFAIWDTKRRSLFAARDPTAMRALAYHVRPGRWVAVATEVKQLLALPDVPVRLNEVAVYGDLLATLGRPSWSFYEGIFNVAPGHALIVDATGHRTERYWSPDPSFRLWRSTEIEYADLLREQFREAVAARLRVRRPAGILLSGGVDSGSVGATAAWLIERQLVDAPALHALCWAFERFPQCDERHVSNLLIEHFGMAKSDVPVDDAGPLAGYPAHGPDRDEPFFLGFQPAIERSLAVARSAGLGVVLGGDRGDLVIGSTGWDFLRLARARRWNDVLRELAEYRRGTGDRWTQIIRDQLVGAVLARVRRRSVLGWLSGPGRRGGSDREARPSWLLPSRALDEAALEYPEEAVHGLGPARALRYEWIFTQLQIRGVAWSERTYARFGLGFADPFSDRRVIELSLALPQAVINRPGDLSKPLMRRAMYGIMPEEARRRVTKILPTPLFDESLRHQATPTILELMSNPRVAQLGWVDAKAWRMHYEAWRSGMSERRTEWWRTLLVEAWLRKYW